MSTSTEGRSDELTRLDLIYRRDREGSRKILIPADPISDYLALDFKYYPIPKVYTNAIVDTYAADQIHKSVSLTYRVGVDVFSHLSVEFYHFSEHKLDQNLRGQYPLENGVAVIYHVIGGR